MELPRWCIRLHGRPKAVVLDPFMGTGTTLVAAKLEGPLCEFKLIECTVVGSRRMAQVHREFLNIPGATDVITFPYGEILVCAPVAAARSEEFRHTITDEITLYVIHGLLHLAGHDDIRPSDASRMAREQEKILCAAIKSHERLRKL